MKRCATSVGTILVVQARTQNGDSKLTQHALCLFSKALLVFFLVCSELLVKMGYRTPNLGKSVNGDRAVYN